MGTDSFFVERSPGAQDLLPPHLRSASNSTMASGSGMYTPVTPPPRYSLRNYWNKMEDESEDENRSPCQS